MTWKLKLKEKPYKLLLGDCIEVMKKLPPNSFHLICTDPPYNLSFMGKEWDSFGSMQEYMKFSRRWAKQAFRVLKPGGYLLSFSGTRTYHWMAVGIELAGFVCRDMISYLYGSGMPKSRNVGKDVTKIDKNHIVWNGYGTNLKPCQEPVAVFQKPISEKTIAANCLKWGTGAINIDAGRVNADEKLGRHNKVGKTSTLFNVNRKDHSTDESVYVDNSSNKGRWPGNIVHDGSKEVLDCFPNTKSGKDKNPTKGKVSGFFGQQMAYYSTEANYGDSGSAGRFFYCAKVSSKERHQGVESLKTWQKQDLKSALTVIKQQQKGILDTTTVMEKCEWNMTWCGKENAAPYQKVIKYITKTKLKQIMILITSNSLQLSNIKEYIQDALKISTENRLNLADLVEFLNLWIQNTTNAKMVFALNARLALLKELLNTSNGVKTGNRHETVKPVDLMRYLASIYCPHNGVVLDPFMGSGSTGIACIKAGKRFIGIEKDPGYYQIAHKRVNHHYFYR